MRYSIIIPTFNSEKYIKDCLDSVFSITYPKENYEVIVVDGGSTDRTLEIIKNYNVRVVFSNNISISNSRNVGVSVSNGQYLVFIDSDCRVNKNLFMSADKYLNRYYCYGSFAVSPSSHGWVSKTWLVIESKREGEVEWIPSLTMIVRKDVFDYIGGFNEKLKTGEDVDLCKRLRGKGYKIYNDPKIASEHVGQTDSFKDFFKKEMWRGSSLFKGIKEHGLKKEGVITTLLTLFHFFMPVLLIISLFIHYFLALILFGFLLIPSFLLSIRKVIYTKRYGYCFNILILIFIYQIARALSLMKYKQFKDLL